MGQDGRLISPPSAGCFRHNCVEIVRRDDGAWRCLLCHLDDVQFQREGKPQHNAMMPRYDAWTQGKCMSWVEAGLAEDTPFSMVTHFGPSECW